MSTLQNCWTQSRTQAPLYDQSVVRWVIAFSGGADSTCLLHLISMLEHQKPLLALHINHGLHADANAWQAHCARQCQALDVAFESISVDVETTGSVEENARRVRYRAFESVLKPGDILLQAHHADDQVETVLFNLLRGNAAVGLLGMPADRPLGAGRLYRPLLTVPKSELTAWCQEQGLDWIEDDSNLDTTMDRSFLRHSLLPVIERRWTGIRETLSQALERDIDARRLLADIAKQDCRMVSHRSGLSIERLRGLLPSRSENLLRYWIRSCGFPHPPQKMLPALRVAFLDSAQDAAPYTAWQNAEIRRYNGVMYINARKSMNLPSGDIEFDGSAPLDLGVGAVSVISRKGTGIRKSNQLVNIRFRSGGEKIKIRGTNRKLKKVLQENGVPPWLRVHLPLIFQDDQLIAVPGVAAWNVPPITASDVQVDPDEEGTEFWFEENCIYFQS